MNRMLIVKLGSTFPELAAQRGDFEDWIEARLGLPPPAVSVVCSFGGDSLPAPRSLKGGVILTGSHAMVTEGHAWSRRTAAWIVRLVAARVPLLGICYGHQLIAHALGGRVGPNPRGRETGTVTIRLLDAAARDPLFRGLPRRLKVHASHRQSVLALPPGAKLLASNDMDPHHAFSVGAAAWGVQFHPEFDVPAMKAYVRSRADDLRAEGRSPSRLLRSLKPTPRSESLLPRFAAIAAERS